jgi:acyl carrier protein
VAAPLFEISAIVRNLLHDDDLDVSPTTRFDDLDNWDAMDLIAVVVEAECRYHVQFDLPEIDRVITVGDLLQMIEAKQALAVT